MGHVPFDGLTEKEIYKNILNFPLSFKEALNKGKSVECIDLMKKVLYKESSSRLTSSECVSHRWLQTYGRDTYEREKVKEILNNFKSFGEKGPL